MRKGVSLFIISSVLLLSVFLIFSVNSASPDFTIEGNSVYINDSNVYINITPHTSNSPIIEFKTHSFSGDVDFIIGVNTDNVIPVGASYNPQIENVSKSYICNYNFNFTTSPNFAWCYKNTTTVDDFNVTNGSKITIVFNREFDTGNISTKTINWIEEEEVWTDISGVFNSVNLNYQGFNKWFYKTGVNINAGQLYKLKLELKSTTFNSYKYFFGVKPSSQTIQQSIDAGTFYYIDPWTADLNANIISYYKLDRNYGNNTVIDELFNHTGTNFGATGGVTGQIGNAYSFDGSSAINLTDFSNLSSWTISFWVNITDPTVTQTIFALYENNGIYFETHAISDGFWYRSDTAGGEDRIETGPANASQWYHIVGTGNSSFIELFIDSVSQGIVASGTPIAKSLGDRIGAYATGPTAFMTGVVDEVGVWGRQLSNSEITDLYNDGVGITYTADFNNAPHVPIINFPANMTNSSTSTVVFEFNISDGEDATGLGANVYANWTSSWLINQTNSSVINATQTNFTIGIPDGTWLFTVESNDTGGLSTFAVNYTIRVDTVFPEIDYLGATKVNNSNVSQNWVYANVSITEIHNGSTTYNLFNSGGLVETKIYSTPIHFYNFTGLSDGVHYYNVTQNDTFGNTNTTETRFITLDTTAPVLAYLSATEGDNANVSESYIYVNISVTEVNEKNVTFTLFNSGGEENTTIYPAGIRFINWTSLSDGVYTYNVTVNDTVGNTASLTSRTITLDTTNPLIDFISPTEVNNSNFSRDWIYANISITEINRDSTTFRIYNSTGEWNSTIYTTSQNTINWTALEDAVYYFNVTVNDTANNVNTTLIRFATLDNIAPNINYEDPTTSAGNLSQTFIEINITADGGLDTIIIYVFNSTSLVQTNTSTTSPLFVNLTGLPDEEYTINATANDSSNNLNSTSDRIITLDTTNPTLTINNPTGADEHASPTVWKVTTNENATCTVAISSGTSNKTMTNSDNVTHVYSEALGGESVLTSNFYCLDRASNLGSGSVTFLFRSLSSQGTTRSSSSSTSTGTTFLISGLNVSDSTEENETKSLLSIITPDKEGIVLSFVERNPFVVFWGLFIVIMVFLIAITSDVYSKSKH